MGISLSGSDGRSIVLPRSTWTSLLISAHGHGWRPAGTEYDGPPESWGTHETAIVAVTTPSAAEAAGFRSADVHLPGLEDEHEPGKDDDLLDAAGDVPSPAPGSPERHLVEVDVSGSVDAGELQHGWNPMNYFSNDGQFVTAEDADAIAAALRRAYPEHGAALADLLDLLSCGGFRIC